MSGIFGVETVCFFETRFSSVFLLQKTCFCLTLGNDNGAFFMTNRKFLQLGQNPFGHKPFTFLSKPSVEVETTSRGLTLQ